MYGMYAHTKVTIAIVPASGPHAEQERGQANEDPVERRDDRDAEEVAPERDEDVARDRLRERERDAEMPVDRPPQRGAVLEQEEEAEEREREPEDERGDALDPRDDAVPQRRDDLRGVALERALRAVGRARGARRGDARVVQPALDLAGGGVQRRRDLRGLGGEAADDEDEDEDGEDGEPEQDEEGAGRTADPVLPSHPSSGLVTAASTVATTTGPTIVNVAPRATPARPGAG